MILAAALLASTTCPEAAALDDRIRDLLRTEYVIAETGEAAADRWPGLAGRSFETPEALAGWIDDTLTGLTGDGHVSAGWIDPDAPERDWTSDWRDSARASNAGIRQVGVFDGNIGYLDIDSFHDVDLAGRPLLAAFAFLAETDALVIDVRGNGGGSGATVAAVRRFLAGPGGYPRFAFLDRDGVDHAGEWYGGFTPLDVPMAYPADNPVYVLIDDRSFSGSEELAYGLQADGRAVIVGAASGGGANPPESFDLPCSIRLWLPTWQPVHPATGTNWEAVGVVPDIAGGPDPLATALEAARAQLAPG